MKTYIFEIKRRKNSALSVAGKLEAENDIEAWEKAKAIRENFVECWGSGVIVELITDPDLVDQELDLWANY